MNGVGHTGSRYAALCIAPLQTIERSPLRGAAHYAGEMPALPGCTHGNSSFLLTMLKKLHGWRDRSATAFTQTPKLRALAIVESVARRLQ